MLAVVLAAVLFLIFNPEPGNQTTATESSSSGNAVADNVSRFYSEFRASSRDPIKEKFGDFVVPLDKDDTPIDELLSKSSKTTNKDVDWQGDFKQRAFPQGSTLMNESMSYFEQEGLRLVWHLDQDFIVKNRFISENTLVGMLEEVAQAIDANFLLDVQIYYCEAQATMVITDKLESYLIDNCRIYQEY